MDALSAQVDVVLTRVQRKYKEYGIKEKPFVVVKADHGTHELGIVTVRDAHDMQALRDRVKTLAQDRKKHLCWRMISWCKRGC